jgi:hypothetical protein
MTRMFLRDLQAVSRISRALDLAQLAKKSSCVDYIPLWLPEGLVRYMANVLVHLLFGSLDEPVSSTFTGFTKFEPNHLLLRTCAAVDA